VWLINVSLIYRETIYCVTDKCISHTVKKLKYLSVLRICDLSRFISFTYVCQLFISFSLTSPLHLSTTMRALNQLGLLLWKNFLLQSRKIVVTVLEIGIPCLFALILIFIRQNVKIVDFNDPLTWAPFKVNTFNSTVGNCTTGCKLYYAPNSSTVATTIMQNTMAYLNNVSGMCCYFLSAGNL